MNERIRELMAQAGFDPSAIERMGIMPQAEKFAELIVRECARLVMTQHMSTGFTDYDEMDPYDRGRDDAASCISGMIRGHFGVK